MKFTEYFIKHRVTSIILNLMILIIGVLALRNISLREYPKVNLPVLSVRTPYPNASSELVESSVTNILEDAISGIAGIKSISSTSEQNTSFITLHFVEGTNMENAILDVRNAIASTKQNLPEDVKESEITRGGQNGSVPFFALSITSSEMDFGELTHYTSRYIINNFRSVQGVSWSQVWGQPYTMEVTLDPKKMYNYGINVNDIINALKKYNVALPVGKYRDTIPSSLDIRVSSEEEFRNIHITNVQGKPVYLDAVSNIKLSTNKKQFRVRIDGKPGLALALERNVDANPLDVAKAIKKEFEKLKKTLPAHLNMNILVDQSIFIDASLQNIYTSIFEAVLLVLLIVFLFLGNFRATFIPVVTIPISLIGSIAIMHAFGMSINTFTLLAMVLAIGLVVDDAIVVLENISRHIEEGMKPLDAAIKGSSEIGFAVIAMTLTLASVYAPIAFIKGILGQVFMEFAVALAGSVIISGIVALTLSPMMCRTFLKPHASASVSKMNQIMSMLENKYQEYAKIIFHKPLWILGTIGICIILSIVCMRFIPKEIVPKEDRGMAGIYVPPIPGKNLDDMEEYSSQVEKVVANLPEKELYLSFLGNWGASTVVPLLEHGKRSRSQQKIVESFEEPSKDIPSIDAWPWGWNSGMPGLDDVMAGSNLTFAISTTGSYDELSDYADKMQKALTDTGKFIFTKHDVKFDTKEYNVVLDKNKLSNLQIVPETISQEISAFFSGNSNLQFAKDGILYTITLKGATNPWSLNELYVTNYQNKKVSIGSFAKLEEKISIATFPHYNQMRTATITAMPIPIYTMDSTMKVIEETAQQVLPKQFKTLWTGAAEVAIETAGTMVLIFVMAIIFIYAILAVQFDNFFDPLIIMVTVPLACTGGLLATWATGQSFNVYTQIGLVTLVGLITKHGILIVEFANKLLPNSNSIESCVTEAAVIRLRPILMTTGAMILGSFPLVFSSGAGSEARTAIGIVLVGGLSFGTICTLFVLPKIYYWIKKATRNWVV